MSVAEVLDDLAAWAADDAGRPEPQCRCAKADVLRRAIRMRQGQRPRACVEAAWGSCKAGCRAAGIAAGMERADGIDRRNERDC